jgi:hypothetical protein
LHPDAILAAFALPRAEEAWQPVIFGALIPFAGVVGVGWLLWRAVKDNPENDLPEEERPSSPKYKHANLPLAPDPPASPPAEAKEEGGPADPPPSAT